MSWSEVIAGRVFVLRFIVPAALSTAAGCGSGDAQEAATTEEPVIFGADERQDYGAMAPVDQWTSRAVALHVLSSGLSCSGATCTLATQPFNTDPEFGMRLCNNVRFKGQLLASWGNCTAWLVAPDLVATAGHCIDTSTCASARYVFGFNAAANGGSEVTSFPTSDVYSCAQVVSQVFNGTGPSSSDYALVRLDRAVRDRIPFVVHYTDQVTAAEQLSIFGHPSALPLKLTRNTQVRDTTSATRFYANGDIFGGNSGGPVIDLATGVAQGITVTQPPPRFVVSSDAQGTCTAYRTCPDTGCTDPSLVFRFTGVTRITLVPGIPVHAALVMAVL